MAEELRCMAEGKGDDWFALCVDLDIAVQGHSFAEVRESLETAIDMYLERAAELPEDERRSMLDRRAPWLARVRFELLSLLSRFDNNRHRPFTLSGRRPVHA